MSNGSALQDADVPLYLHAELLPNIRQITLYVSFPKTPALDRIRPQIRLSESRKAATVSLPEPLDHVTETIKLPARVSHATRRTLNVNTAPVTVPGPEQSASPKHDYSFRMHIDPNDEALRSRDELIDDYVPWTAADMSPSTRVRCRACGNALLKTSTIGNTVDQGPGESIQGWVWKDLPSGNWAEMMDFWHCHKPDPHEEGPKAEASAALKIEEQNAQVKGYGASNRVEAIPGTAFIDVATLLLAESDCVGLRKSNEKAGSTRKILGQNTLECNNCHSTIGMEDPSTNGWRLLKANVSLNTNRDGHDTDEDEWQSYSTEVIVAAQLLELTERESARRFVVHCGLETGLLLWAFNPDLCYSNASSGHSVNAQHAMKVLFQERRDIDYLLHPEVGNVTPLSVEELELPAMTFGALFDALRGSNEMLPFSARTFNEWRVGLLSRFSRNGRT